MKDIIKVDYKKNKIRIFTAIAITKLIRKLPLKIFILQFERLLRNICELLKSREFEVRENARKVLIEISLLVGPYFMFMIIKEL